MEGEVERGLEGFKSHEWDLLAVGVMEGEGFKENIWDLRMDV